MQCDYCQKDIRQVHNEVVVSVVSLKFHLTCAADLQRKGEYDIVVSRLSKQKVIAKQKSRKFIPGLGYV